MKYIAIALMALLLTGCNEDEAETVHPQIQNLPPGLQGCEIYRIRVDGKRLWIVKCPHADVSTTTSDKHPTTVMTRS